MIWNLIVTDGQTRFKIECDCIGHPLPDECGFYECVSDAGRRILVNKTYVVSMYPGEGK